jgi:hypothetical protein
MFRRMRLRTPCAFAGAVMHAVQTTSMHVWMCAAVDTVIALHFYCTFLLSDTAAAVLLLCSFGCHI